MAEIQYLTRELYDANAKAHGEDHELWKSAAGRWHYHDLAVSLAKKVPVCMPSQVLEAGSIGAQIVQGSDTLDTPSLWSCIYQPTYKHDMRCIPWPIERNKYQLFIALRVWQHLIPCQIEAICEAFQIAKYLILGIPELTYPYATHDPLNDIIEKRFRMTIMSLVKTIPRPGETDCNLYLIQRNY